jgi:hypothetical protein
MLKPGDKVKIKRGGQFSNGEYEATIEREYSNNAWWLKEIQTWVFKSSVEPVVQYEDGWRLNDGKVEIPSDAKTIKDSLGDIVAFKLVKKPVVKEYVRYTGFVNYSGTYETSSIASSTFKHKIIFVETGGVLTDIRWEK